MTGAACAALTFGATASAAPPVPENPQVQIDTQVGFSGDCTILVTWTWDNARGGREYVFSLLDPDRGVVGRSAPTRLKDGSTGFSSVLLGLVGTQTTVYGIVTDPKKGEQVGSRIPATIDCRVP